MESSLVKFISCATCILANWWKVAYQTRHLPLYVVNLGKYCCGEQCVRRESRFWSPHNSIVFMLQP